MLQKLTGNRKIQEILRCISPQVGMGNVLTHAYLSV